MFYVKILCLQENNFTCILMEITGVLEGFNFIRASVSVPVLDKVLLYNFYRKTLE